MTKPNLPASATDEARLIARVEQLERALARRNTSGLAALNTGDATPFYVQGANPSDFQTTAQSFAEYAATLEAVVPAVGNLLVTIDVRFSIEWLASPADPERLVSIEARPEVDGASNGFYRQQDAGTFITSPPELTIRSLSATCAIACPEPTTRIVKAYVLYNALGDVFGGPSGGDVVDNASAVANITALFIPGQPISDGSLFTP